VIPGQLLLDVRPGPHHNHTASVADSDKFGWGLRRARVNLDRIDALWGKRVEFLDLESAQLLRSSGPNGGSRQPTVNVKLAPAIAAGWVPKPNCPSPAPFDYCARRPRDKCSDLLHASNFFGAEKGSFTQVASSSDRSRQRGCPSDAHCRQELNGNHSSMHPLHSSSTKGESEGLFAISKAAHPQDNFIEIRLQ